MNDLNRRNFIKTTALAGAGLTVGTASASTKKQSKMPFKSKLKIGLIGVGLRVI